MPVTVRASDIPFSDSKPQTPQERIFRTRGDAEYSLEIVPDGITFYVSRLRRSSHELWGELSVSLSNGHFPQAQTVDSVILAGDLNFSSVQARKTRGKDLAERSHAPEVDWHGLVEETAGKVIAAERAGQPATVLADEPAPPEDTERWDIQGFPILRDHPTVLFGSGSAGKSYLAMWMAGTLAAQGIPVLYADWEFSVRDHRRRFERLFPVMPRALFYVRCDHPIKDEIQRLTRLVHEHKCQYVICDSMVFALEGAAEGSEQAGIYFRAIRALRVGSLSLAHTTKVDDDAEKQVYGSVFFQNGARSVWYVDRAMDNPPGELQVGLFHRKSNVGELLAPRGYKLVFRGARTMVEPLDIDSVDELAAKMPALARLKRILAKGPMKVKTIAEEMGTTVPLVWKTIGRHRTQFAKFGDKIGLAAGELEF